jgi:predicted RNase H-like HicB family nuclease
MSESLKDKTILVWDNGLYTSLAERLARDFKKVLYYVPWKSSFPTSNLLAIGTGLPNIVRVENVWDIVKSVDAVVFPDIYDSDAQAIISEMNIPVWGCHGGDELELNRWKFRNLLKKLGLPVSKAERVTGIPALRKHLMSVENKFIKISKTRGDTETFHHFDYVTSEAKLDALDLHFGGLKYTKEFIIEDPIEDAVEIGSDSYFVGGYPDSGMVGIEVKDLGYIGSFQKYDDLDEGVRLVNDKLAPILKSYGYRNFISTEIRRVKDESYFIDICCRQASPAGETYQEVFENISEIIWYGAHGQLINPIKTANIAVEALIYSKDADLHWTAIQIAKESEQWTKLFHHCRIHGIDYVVPTETQMKAVGVVLGLGDTLEEAIDHLKTNAAGINGFGLDVRVDPLAKAILEIEAAKEEGVEFIDGPLPKVEDVVE